jgi:hypothetical protein
MNRDSQFANPESKIKSPELASTNFDIRNFLFDIRNSSAYFSEKICETLRETDAAFLQILSSRYFITRFLISTSLRSVSFGMTVIPGGQRSASRGLASLLR